MAGIRTERHGDHSVCVLEDAGSSVRILTTYGFNCYSFQCAPGGRTFELLAAADHFADAPSRASGNGTPVLFPFPNRVRGGRFTFRAKEYELPRNERGKNAIHGLVIDRPWRILPETGTGAEVTGQFQLSKDAAEFAPLWPADFVLEITYRLEGNRLTGRVRVTNPDERPLPWGFGLHPYYRLPLGPASRESHAIVRVPAELLWELEDLLPTGRTLPVSGPKDLREGRPLSELHLDDLFTGLRFLDDWCRCLLADRDAGVEVELRFDRLFRELVVYMPPRRGSICLEPYTCVTDAINLDARGVDAGLGVLGPGETAEGRFIVEARSLVS